MKSIFLILISAVLLGLGGCANVPAILEAAAHDPASVHVEINTLYGRVVYDRNMPRTRTVTITP